MELSNEETRFQKPPLSLQPDAMGAATSPVGQRKAALSPAEQILARRQAKVPYPYNTAESEALLDASQYLLGGTDVGTLSRSMTALGLSSTIPEEPADVDLDSATLNAKRIASKSAIDLVGLNEDEVFDASAPLSGDFGSNGGMSGGFPTGHVNPQTDDVFSLQMTMKPTRSIIVSHVSPLLTDENIQMLFQMSGEVQCIRMEYRYQGVIHVSYYDIRSAIAAKEQLNGMAVADQYLSVQFVKTPGSVGSFTEGTVVLSHVDSSLDAQQVATVFSAYGQVKQVHNIPEKENCRLVEFYDVRHATAAIEALNKGDAIPQQNKNTGGLPVGLKQTMSLQQLAGGGFESEQDEDQSSRSWDGSAQAMQQMDSLMRMSDPTTPAHSIHSGGADGMTKSMSFGSGLGDLKGGSEATGVAPENASSKGARAIQLTREVADSLRLPDSPSGLGGAMFPGQSGVIGGGLGAASKMHYGSATSNLMASPHRHMSGSFSVGTGLDSYGNHNLGNQGMDAGLLPFSSQQSSGQFQQGLGMGMAPGAGGNAGLGFGHGYVPPQQTMDASALLAQPNSNLLQTIAAAQAAGVNLYDILARIPNSNLGTLSQFIAANQGSLSPQQQQQHQQQQQQFGGGGSGGGGGSLLETLTSQAASPLARRSAQNPTTISTGPISSPSYGIGTNVSAGGSEFASMSKSASSPALHASSEDRELTVHRGGRLSRRNVDPVIEAERRAQQQRLYALDLEKIRRGEDKRTTLMIKNIPNKYTQKMLLASIDETLKGTYDFFYLPIDFKNKCNVGYGFINMRNPENIVPLVERFHNKKWERFNSEKICCVAYGRIQGKQALINHFQNSSLMHEDKKHRPVLFITEGPNKGDPEAFPMGSNIRPKITLKDRDFRSRERSGHCS